MSVYITGDLHGDFNRILTATLCENPLTKNDILIALGDVGLILSTKPGIREKINIRKFDRTQYTFAFISGNHDNEDRLDKYPVSSWNGGRVHVIHRDRSGRPKIVHMLRGETYEINGSSFFAFGGSGYHEKNMMVLDPSANDYNEKKQMAEENHLFYRTEGIDYWKRCMASEEEMKQGIRNLEIRNNKVDYILTHCSPSSVQKTIYNGDNTWSDYQTDYLQKLKDTVEFKQWYFGHYHCDEKYDGCFQSLYHNVIKI